jgi:CRP/FNR family transcriptional regulator
MADSKNSPVVDFNRMKIACKGCSLRELCLPLGLDEADLSSLTEIIKRTRNLKKNDYLYRIGDKLQSLYAIKSGSIKSLELAQDGYIQITGFHLPGELLGVDAISDERHPCDAVALEPVQVCEIPLDRLENLAQEIPGLQKQLLRIMSKEIVKEQGQLMMLGKMTADARLATCLLSLSDRFKSLGLPAEQFRLSMSRQDLGDYLGLALETVSRLFSRFQENEVIKVEGRLVQILNFSKLQSVAGENQDWDQSSSKSAS